MTMSSHAEYANNCIFFLCVCLCVNFVWFLFRSVLSRFLVLSTPLSWKIRNIVECCTFLVQRKNRQFLAFIFIMKNSIFFLCVLLLWMWFCFLILWINTIESYDFFDSNEFSMVFVVCSVTSFVSCSLLFELFIFWFGINESINVWCLFIRVCEWVSRKVLNRLQLKMICR